MRVLAISAWCRRTSSHPELLPRDETEHAPIATARAAAYRDATVVVAVLAALNRTDGVAGSIPGGGTRQKPTLERSRPAQPISDPQTYWPLTPVSSVKAAVPE